MNLQTVKLLVPVIAITMQSNLATTIIPPYLKELSIPVAGIGTLISLGPIFALLSRLPVGMVYSQARARNLIAGAVLVMGVTHYFYSFVTNDVTFAVVHSLNGLALGAVTTFYLAFYVDSLPPGENRNHAMGYYVGSLALGYSTGSFFGGFLADHFGYGLTFQTAAILSVIPMALLWLLSGSSGESIGKGRETSKVTLKESFRAILEPGLAIVVIVALFLNLLHQMGSIFISLYGLAVGMSLTQIGVIRAAYAGCNAVTRPISGHVVDRFGHRRLSYLGLPLQSAVLMLIPLFTGFGTLLAVYVLSGFMRAVVVVANAAGLVQEVPESKVRRGVASGIFNAAGDMGNILGPALGGFIAHATSLGGVFVVGPVASTIVFLMGTWAVRRRSIVKH